jgi:cell division protein FtsW (lipid II flippase)
MSNTQMWSLIVGFLLPLIIAVIQQATWSDGLRAIVAFVACLVAAIGQVLIELSSWDWRVWIQSVLLIFVTAIATYKRFWVPVGIAPAIEVRTSPTRTNTTRKAPVR